MQMAALSQDISAMSSLFYFGIVTDSQLLTKTTQNKSPLFKQINKMDGENGQTPYLSISDLSSWYRCNTAR